MSCVSSYLWFLDERKHKVFQKEIKVIQIIINPHVLMFPDVFMSITLASWKAGVFLHCWLCALKLKALVLCLPPLTFKRLLITILEHSQGKILKFDLYMAFPNFKHLLSLRPWSAEKLLRGSKSSAADRLSVIAQGNFLIFSHWTMEWKGYFGLLEDWI